MIYNVLNVNKAHVSVFLSALAYEKIFIALFIKKRGTFSNFTQQKGKRKKERE